jgi:hypothetical protein
MISYKEHGAKLTALVRLKDEGYVAVASQLITGRLLHQRQMGWSVQVA